MSKTYFTVRTTGYEGPELGPKDTVTVHVQRYNAAGLIVSREVLEGIITETDVLADPADLAAELEADDPSDTGAMANDALRDADSDLDDAENEGKP